MERSVVQYAGWASSTASFQKIADNSKIFTNIGLIYASLGEHDLAVS